MESDTAEARETPLASEEQFEVETAVRIYVCDRCGARMIERHCKIVCINCGHRFDCSDLNIYFD